MGREEQIEEREVLDSIFPEEIKSMYLIAEDHGFSCTFHENGGVAGRLDLFDLRAE